jgi:hypothetical protein
MIDLTLLTLMLGSAVFRRTDLTSAGYCVKHRSFADVPLVSYYGP